MEKRITLKTAIIAKQAGFTNGTDGWMYNTWKGKNTLFNWQNDQIRTFLQSAYDCPGNDYSYINNIREVFEDTEFDNDDDVNFAAPTQSALQTWLRVNYKFNIHLDMTGAERYALHFRYVDVNGKHWPHWERREDKYVIHSVGNGEPIQIKTWDDYEEALEIGLHIALQTIISDHGIK